MMMETARWTSDDFERSGTELQRLAQAFTTAREALAFLAARQAWRADQSQGPRFDWEDAAARRYLELSRRTTIADI